MLVEYDNSKTEMCVQCKLQKGNSTRIIWGDSTKAIIGREVKIEEDNGEWTNGWVVKEIYGNPLPKKIVQHRSHDHKRQLKASDI